VNIPITVFAPNLAPSFLRESLLALIQSIEWEDHDDQRREAFFNRKGTPYQYGVGRGFRPLYPQREGAILEFLWNHVSERTLVSYDACFLNYYKNERGNLGWHSDDSPSIDQTRPVSVMSLGAERWTSFRKKPDGSPSSFFLRNGSVLMMHPGMQAKYQHAVLPDVSKHGPRISLVFRGLK